MDGNAALQASEIAGSLSMLVGLWTRCLFLLSFQDMLDRLYPGDLLGHGLSSSWWWWVGVFEEQLRAVFLESLLNDRDCQSLMYSDTTTEVPTCDAECSRILCIVQSGASCAAWSVCHGA